MTWKYNWKRDNFDALAGALAAGHIIECGCQATGGNYAFFKEVPSFDNVPSFFQLDPQKNQTDPQPWFFVLLSSL